MSEVEILICMVKALPILLAVWIFMHLLLDEYKRAMEVRDEIFKQVRQEIAENERRKRAADRLR